MLNTLPFTFRFAQSDPASRPDPETQWRRDPLSHPDIRKMSAREIADLQFQPGCQQAD